MLPILSQSALQGQNLPGTANAKLRVPAYLLIRFIMRRLTLFDLDNTLLAGDSDYEWGRFLVDQGVVDADAHTRRNEGFHADYLRGELDIHAYQRFCQQPLLDHPLDEMLALRARFISERIRPLVATAAPELIRQHQVRGDALVIITATNRFITQPIAELLGIATLLATEPEIVDGAYTGGIAGTPCYQDGKITRLKQWLADNGLFDGIGAYSDSHNDLPLLEFSDRPVAVDPDEILADTAQRRGWPIVSLRHGDGAEVFSAVA